jgi:hypothetical protein
MVDNQAVSDRPPHRFIEHRRRKPHDTQDIVSRPPRSEFPRCPRVVTYPVYDLSAHSGFKSTQIPTQFAPALVWNPACRPESSYLPGLKYVSPWQLEILFLVSTNLYAYAVRATCSYGES